MTIKPVIRQRKLTSFNGGTTQKAQFPVLLYVYDRGKKYYLSTSFTTSDVKFSGCFNDKGVDYQVNKSNTEALGAIVNQLVTWYNNNYYTMSVEDVKLQFTAMSRGQSVGQMVAEKTGKHLADWMDEFADTHDEGTRKIYRRTAMLLREYQDGVDIEDITLDWLEDFVDWMTYTRVNHNHGKLEIGLSVSTQGIHLRNLKATLRWVGKPSKHMVNNRVFEEYVIKNDAKRDKFYLTEQMVADFRDYPCEPWQEKYRDFCMLSLYLAGMNTNDLCLMRGLTNGRFVKARGKTDVQIDLPVCEEAMAIISKYRGSKYLLNVMDSVDDYQTFAQHLNKAIKKIGLAIKVKDKLGKMRKLEYHAMFPEVKTYSFRYSFATICANIEGITDDMVGVCMAHAWAIKGNVTTQRYVLNNRGRIDRTMRKFIEHLRGFKGRSKEVIDDEIRRRDGLA